MARASGWAKVEEWGNKSVARALNVKPQNIDKVKGFDAVPSKEVEGRRVWRADDIRAFVAKRQKIAEREEREREERERQEQEKEKEGESESTVSAAS